MITGTRAIITGCAMRMGLSVFWGDLHIWNGFYVFNAVVDPKTTEPTEVESNTIATHKGIIVINETSIMSQRGVFVMPCRSVIFNDAAMDHMKKWEPHLVNGG